MKKMMSFIILILLFTGCVNSKKVDENKPIKEKMKEVLSFHKTKNKLPSIVGCIINDNQIEIYSEGLRKIEDARIIADYDMFHIGSLTKAITATMLATLVEEGKLKWQSKVLEVFPEFEGKIPKEYGEITLYQLLTHNGGISSVDSLEESNIISEKIVGDNLRERRYNYAKWVLNNSDKLNINKYSYSNGGYVLAAAFAEKVTSKDWETLIQEKIAGPLEINLKYNWPAFDNENQPYGHNYSNGLYTSVNYKEQNWPALFSPAGNISMNIRDYAKFINLHIQGLNGNPKILTKESFEFLHKPTESGYSCGWFEGKNDKGKYFSWHKGSDGTFYSTVLMYTKQNKAAIVFTNCSSEEAYIATETAVIEILDFYN